LNARLSYFTRDLGVETNYQWQEVQSQFPQGGGTFSGGQGWGGGFAADNREFRAPANPGGTGAWNDFNATASAARDALREAAGVDVPDRTFVVVCLAVYLVALVPLNWMIFQALGRVEWAWIAAPLIAIAGTFLVVHQAQLDIGFVRAQTEINLLELQPEHPRGHLARFTALYTSLSTTYDLKFDDPTALAMPFPRDREDRMVRGQGYSTIRFQREPETVRLTGLPVLSNSTNFVHSEQILPLEGTLRLAVTPLGVHQIENRSRLHLRSVGLVAKRSGAVHGKWIGELAPGASAPVSKPELWARLADEQGPFVADRVAEAQTFAAPRLNLEPLFRLAYDGASMEEGEVRLVGRVDEPLAGETVTPEASQHRSATLVVSHLTYAALPAPRPDLNTRQDVTTDNEEDE
jgi:hypothetical protein